MKGLQGLLAAGVLGIIAAALNWIYLDGQLQGIDSLEFLGVREPIRNGETILEKHLAAITVPAGPASGLKETAYLHADLKTVVGIRATRNYQVGDLILRADYRTPPAEIRLKDGERLFWIPVDSHAFVPDLINPGDEIAFAVPAYHRAIAAETDLPENAGGDVALRAAALEEIGPFIVGSLGNRLSSSNLAKSNRLTTSGERLIGIVVSKARPDEWSQANRLYAGVLAGEYRNIGVILLPPKEK